MTPEAKATEEVLEESGRLRVRLLRNNNGAFQDRTGRLVRFGLGHESKKDNEKKKSSDYIGWTPVIITPEMVGQTLPVITAIEMKPKGWRYTGKGDQESAQKRFIDDLKAYNAIAGFATCAEDLRRIINSWFNRFR